MITKIFTSRIRPWYLAVGLAFLCARFSLGAPDQAPEPRLGSAPSSSTWTIQYQYKQADPYPKPATALDAQIFERLRQAYPRLQTVQVNKAGKNRKEVCHYADGSEMFKWIIGDYFLTEMRVTHAISIATPAAADVKFKDDFYDLAWINQADYKGQQDYQGTSCRVYDLKGTADTQEQTAYIDAKTSLPVGIETADATLLYTFRPSSETIELPPGMAAHLKMYLNQTAAP